MRHALGVRPDSSQLYSPLKRNHADGGLSQAGDFYRPGCGRGHCGLYFLAVFDLPVVDLRNYIAGPEENVRSQ